MAIFQQFLLLQYKNWKLQIRRKLVTVLEILIPALFCLLMVGLRTLVDVNNFPNATLYPSYSPDKLPHKLIKEIDPYPIFGTYFMGLAYTPNTNVTHTLMENVRQKLMKDTDELYVALSPLDSEEDLVSYLTTDNMTGLITREQLYLAGIVFDDPTAYQNNLPFNISYTIRPKYAPRNFSFGLQILNSWYTDYLFSPFITPGPRDKSNLRDVTPGYYDEGFLTLQRAIHGSAIEYLNRNAEFDDFVLNMERFPYPPYKNDLFLTAVTTQLPFFIMLSMIFISLYIPKDVVLEKENKLKEAMKMMGMSNWLQWLAWFIKYFVFLAITTLLMSFLLCPPFKVSEKFDVLGYSTFSLIWVFLLLYAVCIICYCFMISTFFNKANAAAAAGGIIFFCLYIPFTFISPRYDTMTYSAKLASCLDFNLAMALGMVVIGRYEGASIGVQWTNLNEPVSVDDNFTLGAVLLMMVLDSAVFLLITWYVDAVFPGDYGIPQPPYFFVLPSYWCGVKQRIFDNSSNIDKSRTSKSEYFEAEPVNLNAGIQIKNLTKTFNTSLGKKTAVNKLHLNMYDGQITALLGHNGAGKTTTMFMLTGFMPPTGGTALVNGYDIREDISSVRSSLGLCPQHDILFDDLTVEEHLYFFARLKRCPREKVDEQIDYYLSTLGLEEKRHSFSKTLSGGQKRKLCVGIALIGDSKVVILDEPTSGMDPSARRHMWDVLQSQRAGRTMILSTHFMDEADHLGDRIAILSEGVLQCCGSSLFLKKKFGAGYHMVMTKTPECDVSKVKDLLMRHVPEATLESNVGAELSFVLPDSKVPAFPQLFSELETKKEELGIMGFGASVTTMEEVFTKVGEGNTLQPIDVEEDEETGDDNLNSGDGDFSYSRLNDGLPSSNESGDLELTPQSVVHHVKKQTGIRLFTQQFKAMLIKRMLYTFRNKALTISQLILPLIFTAITIAIIKTLPDRDGIAPKLPINIDLYGKTTEFYSSGEQGELSGDVSDRFRSLFKSGGDQQLKLVDDPRDEIINTAKYSMKQYNTELIFAVDFGNSSASMKQTDAVVLFNGQPFHAAPAGLLYTDTAILKSLVNDCYSFAAANHPLPRTTRSEIEQAANGIFNANSFSYASSMMFGFSFLASSFVVFLITERSRKIKHSQTVSGVKWYNFWLSTLTWDYVNYLVPALLTVILFAIADIKNLSDVSNGNKQPLYLIILMLMYGFALLPNMYAIQYLFTGPATGYVAVTFFNILTGTTPQLVVTILSVIQSTKDTAKVLDWVFIVLLPNYNMGQGIANLYNNYEYIDLCYNKLPNVTGGKFTLDEICSKLKNTTNPCCKDHCGDSCLNFQEDFFAWESLGMGRSMTFLALQAVIYWTIIILIDTELITKLFYKMRPKVLVGHSPSEIQDEDVVSEREKILSSDANALIQDNEVVISGLSKYFGAKSAVDDVYLTIPQGECFGLLGVNGAGKTTTFKMLTGDETISGGTAYMNGNNIRTDIHEVQRSIGYCPQFDALIDQMTGEEMLYMYARLRGIPEEEIPTVVQNLISALLLDKHKKKLTRAYSGGNKRKLSTAIALMGDPPIIFLDEPTTGMDPVARRMLWQVLMKVRDSGKTLILTSHSMEECEALCTKLAIMVNGVYRCLGSTQHLKNKFGAGYSLIARVKYPADGSLPDIHSVERFVEENFPGSEIKDKHQNLIQYHIHKGELTWAVIFKKLEDNKERLGIEDYSVSQTTLEQVFINFARAQIPPDGAAGCPTRFRQMCCVCCTPEYVKASPLNV